MTENQKRKQKSDNRLQTIDDSLKTPDDGQENTEVRKQNLTTSWPGTKKNSPSIIRRTCVPLDLLFTIFYLLLMVC